MAILGVIQARLSSSRLPKKVLVDIKGISLLERVINQAQKSKKLSEIIVATSFDQSDDELVTVLSKIGIPYHRGPLLNVAERFKEVLEKKSPIYFVRICGDSPFYDASLVDQAIDTITSSSYEIVTNIFKKGFPRGVSVEVFRTETFLKSYPKIYLPEHQEHVTKFFYDNVSSFCLYNLECPLGDIREINLSVDTEIDLYRIQKFIEGIEANRLELNWQNVVKLFGGIPAI